jgi:hypothetical protein
VVWFGWKRAGCIRIPKRQVWFGWKIAGLVRLGRNTFILDRKRFDLV